MKDNLVSLVPIGSKSNGAAILSEYICEFIGCETIDTSFSNGFSRYKFISLVMIFFKVFKIPKGSNVYFCFTPHGLGYFKDIVLLLILKIKKLNCALHIHNNFGASKKQFLFRYLAKGVKIIVINDVQYKYYSEFADTRLIYNSMPVLSGCDENFSHGKVQVSYFSKISIEKGYSLLKAVISSCQDWEFHIAGTVDEHLKDDFYSFVSSSRNVYYHGFVSGADKVQLLNQCNVTMCLSKEYYEASPLVYIEALMFGNLILTTKQFVSPYYTYKSGHELDCDLNNLEHIKSLVSGESYLEGVCRYNYSRYRAEFNFPDYCHQIIDFLEKE